MKPTTHRVLAAEDSPTQAMAIQAHLEEAGFDVSVAANGAEALTMLEEAAFDLVISDVVMPDVDGYELCRRVKELDPGLPVMLLTSLNDPLDVVHALSAGADNFLRKPYLPQELVHRSQSMLHNRELRAAGRAQMGLELFFLGRRFMINADREQILDLLVSTFEDLVTVNQQLRAREEELAKAHAEIRAQLAETATERDRLHTVLEAVPEGMAVFDVAGRIVDANERLAQFLEVPKTALLGQGYWQPLDFVDHDGLPIPTDERCVARTLASGQSISHGTAFDLFVQRPNGDRVATIAEAAPILDQASNVVGAVGTLKDIHALVAHDAITGLAGQGMLIERLSMCDSARDTGDPGLLVASIDRSDRLRELPTGDLDRVMSAVAARLRGALHADEAQRTATAALPAYIGHGEMAVLLTNVETEADLIRLAEFLVEELAGPVEAGGLDLPVTVSISTCLVSDASKPAELISAVAAAARRASFEGGNRVTTSDPGLHADVLLGLQRESELRAAIDRKELVVHYQPELRLRDGQPIGVEALVRWQHPVHGLLGAEVVIPTALDANLIAPVGWRVLEDACHQAATWRRSLHNGDQLRLSVNLAAEQLAEPDVATTVARIMSETELDPSALTLEVTEVGVMQDPIAAANRLQEIKALGVKIAIDDFGTGYSSLLQLRRLPIDVLKIDREFIGGMTEEPEDAAIVAGTVRLARTLGLDVVAEGVETMDQLVQLRVLGCDSAQGYHWSRPLPAEELATWWAIHDRGAGADRSIPTVIDDHRDDTTISYLVHELRTPLTSVLGFAEMLADSSKEVGPELAAIIRNARALNDLLTRLGDARAALEGAGLNLSLASCDVGGLVRSTVTDLGDQLDRPVALHIDPTEPVDVDAGRIKQAVTNLLTNAAKFSPEGAPIEVAVTGDGAHVTISIRDHGPGIPEHRRPELFRRFSRLGSRTKGMGVGLYLSRLIIDAHGGTLRHDHAPQGGSIFSIELSSP